MGLLVDGVWQDEWYDTASTGGRFVRKESAFRRWVTPTGRGPNEFPAAADRYHLYVSLACPWAHRTLIMRRLKGLENAVSVSVVHWRMRERGWTFAPGPCVTGDPINGAEILSQVYVAADPHYTGRVTVPVLWDKARCTIVSNESAEIIRMFNSMRSTSASTGTSTTAYTAPALPPRRPPTKKPSLRCSRPSIGWRRGCRDHAS